MVIRLFGKEFARCGIIKCAESGDSTERKGKPIVRPGFRDFLPTGYSILFMKERRSPTRGDESKLSLIYDTYQREEIAF